VPRHRHDAMVEALAGAFSQVRVGGPFDDQTQIGPLVASRQSDGVESRIVKGISEGATLATGGGRPKDLRKMSVLMPRSLAAWIIRNVGVLGP